MKAVSPAPGSDPPPADISYGVGGIEFIPVESIAAEQAGYAGPGWSQDWLVIASESACGDPIFVDRSHPEFPVLTAMHGEGSWEPSPVAPSWQVFLEIIEVIRPVTAGREHPVGLEAKPLTANERSAIDSALRDLLGSTPSDFWDLLLDEGE